MPRSLGARQRLPDAIDAVRDAQRRHDSRWSRFLFGRLYEQVDEPRHAEALAELEATVKRRGEAADAFLADTPCCATSHRRATGSDAQEGMQVLRSYDQ